jgi:low affinity Fe/Cu permease
MTRWFAQVASGVGAATGHPLAFILSVVACVLWALSGPLFGFSDTWQLVINTGTTVLTFLLVFVIQNTQNRDSAALHLKLDEILRALPQARTELAIGHLEKASEEVLAEQRAVLERLAEQVDDADRRPPG